MPPTVPKNKCADAIYALREGYRTEKKCWAVRYGRPVFDGINLGRAEPGKRNGLCAAIWAADAVRRLKTATQQLRDGDFDPIIAADTSHSEEFAAPKTSIPHRPIGACVVTDEWNGVIKKLVLVGTRVEIRPDWQIA